MDASCDQCKMASMISSRSDYREAKSVQNGGDSMNESSGISRSRVPAFIAMLFGAIFTILLLPAYGQQEVDPTWYDPWAGPTTAVVHPAQTPAGVYSSQAHSFPVPGATHPDRQTGKSLWPAPAAGELRRKGGRLDQTRRH